ncbi:MAG: hypothetical protein LCH53_13205 [Bacteroidetes bacterium]|nr:hypothetical protein [Bacteroidota bacterium]
MTRDVRVTLSPKPPFFDEATEQLIRNLGGGSNRTTGCITMLKPTLENFADLAGLDLVEIAEKDQTLTAHGTVDALAHWPVAGTTGRVFFPITGLSWRWAQMILPLGVTATGETEAAAIVRVGEMRQRHERAIAKAGRGAAATKTAKGLYHEAMLRLEALRAM